MSTNDSSAGPRTSAARDAFTELATLSFDDTSMESLLQRVADLAKQVIPGVAEASVSLIVEEKPTTPAFTGRLAIELDEAQYGHGYGPCLEAAIGHEVREVIDARQDTRWPGYLQVCVAKGALSSLSVPVPVRETVLGALNLYGREAAAFDDVSREAGREFASYVAVAVRNIHLYESTRELAVNLDAAMRSRAVIEQAKGIVMSQRRCDASEAFSMLAEASQRSNRKVRDIAQSLVDGVAGDSPDRQ